MITLIFGFKRLISLKRQSYFSRITLTLSSELLVPTCTKIKWY
ncbi:hypothetical protein X975_07089, partial [Stegodyphus mimosarum]